MATDDKDRARSRRDRQEIVAVLEQDDPAFGHRLRDPAVGRIVDPRLIADRVGGYPRRVHGAQDAQHRAIDVGGGQTPGCQFVAQFLAEVLRVFRSRARFLVEPGAQRGGAVDRAPVRHDPAAPAPIAPQYIVEQKAVLAGIDAVHAVVGAHHRARLADLDTDLERQQIAFAHRRFAKIGRDHGPPGFLRVERVVLDRRDDAARLHAADGVSAQRAGQQRIFAQVFEIAAVARLAHQVHAAGKQDVEALALGFPAHRCAGALDQLRVPGRGHRRARRKCGGAILGPHHAAQVGDAQAGIALGEVRNAQPWDSRNVAGAERQSRRALRRREHERHTA